MKRAIELAELGRGHTSPNPLVGAVVVRDGRGARRGLPRRLRSAARGGRRARAPAPTDPSARRMYVTLEPCCHHGQTPPCTDAIVRGGHQARGGRLRRPDRQGLRPRARHPARRGDRGRQTIDGEVSRAARLLNQPFRKLARTGRPLRRLQVGDEPRRQGRDPDGRLEVDLERGAAAGSCTAGAARWTRSASGSARRSPTTRC